MAFASQGVFHAISRACGILSLIGLIAAAALAGAGVAWVNWLIALGNQL